jgi:hypothetical protein
MIGDTVVLAIIRRCVSHMPGGHKSAHLVGGMSQFARKTGGCLEFRISFTSTDKGEHPISTVRNKANCIKFVKQWISTSSSEMNFCDTLYETVEQELLPKMMKDCLHAIAKSSS